MSPKKKGSVTASLAPQLAGYAKLGRSMRWLPYVMYFHGSSVRSEVVNTDRHGFRWTRLPDGTRAGVETAPPGPGGVLMGGSTAFGVGATCDAATIPSALSSRTGRPWLNFGGRAYCSTQEIVLFLLYADALPQLSHILILSGINDLYMQFASNRFDDHLGAFLYSDLYHRALSRERLGSAWKRWRAAWRAKRGREGQVPFEELLARRGGRSDRVVAQLRRNLSHWAALAAQRSARVLFALQPVFSWLGKPACAEEAALFADRETQDPRRERIFDVMLAAERHAWYSAAIAGICQELGLGFVDLNRALREHLNEDDWLFVDRVHLTDRGYATCADCLAELLE